MLHAHPAKLPAQRFLQHSVYARDEKNIQRLIDRHLWAGYGVYGAIRELVNQRPTKKIEASAEDIAKELKCSAELVRAVIQDFNLFDFSD